MERRLSWNSVSPSARFASENGLSAGNGTPPGRRNDGLSAARSSLIAAAAGGDGGVASSAAPVPMTPPATNAAATRRIVIRAAIASHQSAGGELDARHVSEQGAVLLDRRARRHGCGERLLQIREPRAHRPQRGGIL